MWRFSSFGARRCRRRLPFCHFARQRKVHSAATRQRKDQEGTKRTEEGRGCSLQQRLSHHAPFTTIALRSCGSCYNIISRCVGIWISSTWTSSCHAILAADETTSLDEPTGTIVIRRRRRWQRTAAQKEGQGRNLWFAASSSSDDDSARWLVQ